jgi:hypothetical protein
MRVAEARAVVEATGAVATVQDVEGWSWKSAVTPAARFRVRLPVAPCGHAIRVQEAPPFVDIMMRRNGAVAVVPHSNVVEQVPEGLAEQTEGVASR